MVWKCAIYFVDSFITRGMVYESCSMEKHWMSSTVVTGRKCKLIANA